MPEDFLDEDRAEDNKPELIRQAEDLYYALAHNLTHEATNVILQIFLLVKDNYEKSDVKRKWNMLLIRLEDQINNFENELSDGAEMKLYALLQEGYELSGKPNNKLPKSA